MSPLALIVIALVALWLLAMLLAGFRYAANARARAVAADPTPPRSHAEASRDRG